MDGYIVKKNKDSLRGQIEYGDWISTPSKIVFQGEGQTSTFSPAELLAFGVNGERYEFRMVHISPYSRNAAGLTNEADLGKPYDTTVFLQVFVTGKLDLWELRLAGQTNYYFVTGKNGNPDQLRLITRFHVQENGTTTFEEQEYFKNQLKYLLQDCPAVSDRIGRTSYDAASLQKLIFAYNYCGKDTVDKAHPSGRGRARMLAFAGYAQTSLQFPGTEHPENYETWPASSSVAAGLGMLLPFPRSRNQFSLFLDITFQHFHSGSSVFNASPYSNVTGTVDYTRFKLDVLFRYQVPSGKVRPFVETGMANGVAPAIQAYETYRDVNNDTHTYSLQGGVLHTYMPGWVGGAGVNVGRWDIEGRAEINIGSSNGSEVPSKSSSWYVLAAFKL